MKDLSDKTVSDILACYKAWFEFQKGKHSFIFHFLDDDSKAELKKVIKQPGGALFLAGSLVEEYQPDFDIKVKKSKSEQETSEKTD